MYNMIRYYFILYIFWFCVRGYFIVILEIVLLFYIIFFIYVGICTVVIIGIFIIEYI